MPLPKNGTEYAAQLRTNMADQVGMRLAMMEALEAFHARDTSKMTNVQKKQLAEKLVTEKVMSNDILVGSGAAPMVKLYFEDILSKASADQVVAFINDVGKDSVRGVKEALVNNDDQKLLQAAGGFSKAFSKHLVQNKINGKVEGEYPSVTGGYDRFLKDKNNAEKFAKVVIEPKGFTSETAAVVEAYEAKFRSADQLDGRLYDTLKENGLGFVLNTLQHTIGIGFPEVAEPYIETFDRSQFPVIEPSKARSKNQSSIQLEGIDLNAMGVTQSGTANTLPPTEKGTSRVRG